MDYSKLKNDIYTFMDCYYRLEYSECARENPRNPGDCEICTKLKICKMGFVQ